ncbi:MAG: hypothetical protein WBO35_00905 [Candidatus Saccharimonadales bacterium]|jgi:hypothetical protein
MSKKYKKTKKVQHLHLHLGLYLAVATLFVTIAKSSSELIKTAYAMPVHYEGIHTLQLREAETLHGHAIVVMARRTAIAGA